MFYELKNKNEFGGTTYHIKLNAIFHLYIKKSPSAFAKIELLKLNLIFKNELLIEEQVNIKRNEDLFMHALKLVQRHFYHHPKEGIYQSDEELEIFYNHTMKSYSQYNPTFLSIRTNEVNFTFSDLKNALLLILPTVGHYNEMCVVKGFHRFKISDDDKMIKIQESDIADFNQCDVGDFEEFIISLSREDFIMTLEGVKEMFSNRTIGSTQLAMYGVEGLGAGAIYDPVPETFSRIFKMLNNTINNYEKEFLHFYF